MWIKDEGTREQMYQQIYVGVSMFYPFLPLCSRLIILPLTPDFIQNKQVFLSFYVFISHHFVANALRVYLLFSTA